MIGVPILCCGGVPVLLLEAFRAPRPLVVGVFQAGLAVTILSWIAYPFVLRIMTRSATRRALPSDIDAKLRELIGVKNWGLRNWIMAQRAAPRGEPIITLPSSR